jgi:hypothetical protein
VKSTSRSRSPVTVTAEAAASTSPRSFFIANGGDGFVASSRSAAIAVKELDDIDRKIETSTRMLFGHDSAERR